MTYPSLARRTRRIAPCRVMELVGRAAAREAAGHPVIHLSIGEPDFTAPPPVIEALESAARAGRARYTPANGTPALRSAISHWYAERFGIDVAPARILVTAGASGALTLACAALVDPGEDCCKINAVFVAQYDSTDPQQLLRELELSFQELARKCYTLDLADWTTDFGVQLDGAPLTVDKFVTFLSDDYDNHRREIEAWRKSVSAEKD